MHGTNSTSLRRFFPFPRLTNGVLAQGVLTITTTCSREVPCSIGTTAVTCPYGICFNSKMSEPLHSPKDFKSEGWGLQRTPLLKMPHANANGELQDFSRNRSCSQRGPSILTVRSPSDQRLQVSHHG